MAPKKILQIMPADPGWTARTMHGIQPNFVPLIGWALVEDKHVGNVVVGLVAGEGGVVFADDLGDFGGYVKV